jgi:hypothetical protein
MGHAWRPAGHHDRVGGRSKTPHGGVAGSVNGNQEPQFLENGLALAAITP